MFIIQVTRRHPLPPLTPMSQLMQARSVIPRTAWQHLIIRKKLFLLSSGRSISQRQLLHGESVFQTRMFQIPKSRHSSQSCLDSLVLDDSVSLNLPSFCSRQEIALLFSGPGLFIPLKQLLSICLKITFGKGKKFLTETVERCYFLDIKSPLN